MTAPLPAFPVYGSVVGDDSQSAEWETPGLGLSHVYKASGPVKSALHTMCALWSDVALCLVLQYTLFMQHICFEVNLLIYRFDPQVLVGGKKTSYSKILHLALGSCDGHFHYFVTLYTK